MPRPVHFKIAASDPETLSAFYRPVFGVHQTDPQAGMTGQA
jgi:predicted enzyme related to lactoylglutathione lyase